MKRRVLLVRHDDGPNDDRITTYCRHRGFIADIRRPFLNDSLGTLSEDLAAVVFYGGKYNAYDTDVHPFLNAEYEMMGKALDAGLPVLGICQGAQMLAWHQGAWAGAPDHGQHEFGLYEITPTDEAGDFLTGPLYVTQSHYHTFELPEGAVHLARSEYFENQAFRLGDKTYGLQFHPEQIAAGLRRWQKADIGLAGKPGAQSIDEQNELLAQHEADQARWFLRFLDRFFAPTA
ncbi:glutamine amidotransferase-related protein [Chachezhania antarctica]|uniref:glutamine amidotransferase-related protein n=1 Tax=Chachezhania antarctica TaxID=2340860 RepID=UPI000EAE19F9|nr:glutamine amidotransferase [Chachezhania antarctica]|tara:strand:- start:2554 stop:3252 length:699 start_codon:yes stop_codon:yes gene_type:complete